MANIDPKQVPAIVEKMSPTAIDTYAHLFLITESTQPIRSADKAKVTPQQIEGFISASPYGEELGFFAQMLSCSDAEELNAFYAGCDKEFFKNASVLLSSAIHKWVPDANEQTMDMLIKLSQDATAFTHRLIGELPNNRLESEQLDEAKARYQAANGKAIDNATKEGYLSGITFDKTKIDEIERFVGTHSDSMIAFERISTDDMTVEDYMKFLSDRDAVKKDFDESGMKPLAVSGNYTHSRNPAVPLYQKTDYVAESFITQLPTAMDFCKNTKISLTEYAQNPALIFEQASEYSNALFINKYLHTENAGTKVDFLVDQWLNRGAVGIVDTATISKHSDITIRTLMAAVSDENQLTTEQLNDKLSLFTDRLYQRMNINPEIAGRNPIIAAAKYKNITDIVKDVGYRERPTLPQANKFEYLSNLVQLHDSITNKLCKSSVHIGEQKANDMLQAISVELNANKLSFGDRFFHPRKSAAIKRSLVTVKQNEQRVYVAKKLQSEISPNQMLKIKGLFTDEQLELARNLKLNTLVSRVATRNNFIKMAMCDRISQAELFAEEPSQNFIQLQDVAINEIRTAVEKGDEAYFKNLFVKAGAFINDMKIPEMKFDTPQHAIDGLREIDKLSVFSKDFEQIQGGEGKSLGRVFYEHADSKFVETVSKNNGIIQGLGQAAKVALQSMQRNSAYIGAPIPLGEEKNVLAGAANLGLFKANRKGLCGHTLSEIDVDPFAVVMRYNEVFTVKTQDISKQSLTAAQTILSNPAANTQKLVAKLPKNYNDLVLGNVVPEKVEPFPNAERQKLKEVDKSFAKAVTKPSPGLSVDVGKEKVNEAPVVDNPSK